MLDLQHLGHRSDELPLSSTAVPSNLKRLVKGLHPAMPPEGRDARTCEQPASAVAAQRPRTGLKLKIKFSGLAKKVEVVGAGMPQERRAELDMIGLTEGEWLPPALSDWAELRRSPDDSAELPTPTPLSGAQDLKLTDEAAEAAEVLNGSEAVGPKAAGDINLCAPTCEEHAAASPRAEASLVEIGTSAEAAQQLPQAEAAPRAGVQTQPRPTAVEQPARAQADDGGSARVSARVSDSAKEHQHPTNTALTNHSPSITAAEDLSCQDPATPKASAAVEAETNRSSAGVEQPGKKPLGHSTRRTVSGGLMRAQAIEREPGEASPAAKSSSSSSSGSDSSGDEAGGGSRKRKARGRRALSSAGTPPRAREAGEHSDSEGPDSRKRPRRSNSRSYSHERSREYDRSRCRSREEERRHYGPHQERSHAYGRESVDRRDRDREYERREYDRLQRERAERLERREPSPRRERSERRDYVDWRERSERRESSERRERHERDRYDRDRYDRDRHDGRRTSSRTPEEAGTGPSDRSRRRAPTRERSPRPPSRLGDPLKAGKPLAETTDGDKRRSCSADIGDSDPKSHARDDVPAGKTRSTTKLASQRPEAIAQPFSFADAWNMLHGAGQEDFGSEADIEKLRLEATKAKHDIDSVVKGSGGKYTLDNLVALMRESYLKYMQLCAIWEAALRTPNAPANRTRAKLADEGGLLPCTIALMRSVSNDARLCSPTSDACRILRVLAEKLVAVMQMRLVQVQRGKLQQDRQMLLSCRGAPTTIDSYGRTLPGAADAPGETFQRPSPTDSNASNSTGELSVNPSPARPVARAPFPASRTPPPGHSRQAASQKGFPATTYQGRVTKPGKSGKLAQRPMPHGTPTREEPGGRGTPGRQTRMPLPNGPGRWLCRDDAWAVEPLAWEIPSQKFEHITRSWSLLGGVAAYAGQFRAHHEETSGLMRSKSPVVREAAAMLGFLDVGLGMSNTGALLQLSRDVLDSVSKIHKAEAAEAGGGNEGVRNA